MHLGGRACHAYGISIDLNGKSILSGNLDHATTIVGNIMPVFSVGSLVCHDGLEFV
jgi:hypothetical protein